MNPRNKLVALILLAMVCRANAFFRGFLCQVPILNIFFSFCRDMNEPTTVTFTFRTGNRGTTSQNPELTLQGIASFTLDNLPPYGYAQVYTFELDQRLASFFAPFNLKASGVLFPIGWFIEAMSIKFDGSPPVLIELNDQNNGLTGIWLEEKNSDNFYRDPIFYFNYRYSDRWYVEYVDNRFKAIPSECWEETPQVQRIELTFTTGVTSLSSSLMEPEFYVFPRGGGNATFWTLKDLPSQGFSKTYLFELGSASNECGIAERAYLWATSIDGWYIISLSVKVNDQPEIIVVDGGPDDSGGIWLDGRPYDDPLLYQPAVREPSEGWVINLFSGEFYADSVYAT